MNLVNPRTQPGYSPVAMPTLHRRPPAIPILVVQAVAAAIVDPVIEVKNGKIRFFK